MQCPKCNHQSPPNTHINREGECPKCGIIYIKYEAYLERRNQAQVEESANDKIDKLGSLNLPAILNFIKSAFLHTPEHTDQPTYISRLLCFVIFVIWGAYFIVHGIDPYLLMKSFMHNINLVFHEAGHILFIPFGRFMTILGGSLFQVLLPFSIMIAFVVKQKDIFGGSIMLWWTGQSLIDVSPYIDDAIHRQLPLIGGMSERAHDWGNLLRMTDSLSITHGLANTVFFLGACFIVLSWIWGGYYLLQMKHKIQIH